jgi:hypothetical protein
MRELVKALPLGLGLPVLIGVASVKPEDAVSNLAAWAQWLGIHDVPEWLKAPGIDNKVIIGTIVVGIVYAMAVWGFPRFNSNPITILFDELNPDFRYYSWEIWRRPDRSNVEGWEYRVEIFNNTGKTLQDASVIAEITGETPSTLEFVKTGDKTCDLHPKSSELVRLFLVPEPIEGSKSEVLIRVRAKDTPEATKRFYIDLTQQPSLFNKPVTR